MKLPTATEHEIQQTIINYLKYRGYYCQRLNSGMIPALYGGKKRMIQLSEKGTPDIMAFKRNVVKVSPAHVLMAERMDLLFVEVKRPGKKATPLQEAKMKELTEYGARCIIATSIEDLQAEGI